jgi:hypothetical protein
MKKRRKIKAAKIIESIAFGILVVISIAVLALVLWIHIKD